MRWDRKLDLLPSSTNIISVKAKPGLDNYKTEQAIMAAITLPRLNGETEDAFAERVVIDMDQHRVAAAEFGSRIHKYCEQFHLGDTTKDPELEPYVSDYKRWFSENVKEVIWAERVLINEKVGYAGTADALFLLNDERKALSDIKTQNIKKVPTKTKGPVKNDPAFYKEWQYQLVSYGKCLEVEPDAYLSIVIDSMEPGPCHIKEWPASGHKKAWRSFLACCWLWCEDKDYFCSTYWQ